MEGGERILGPFMANKIFFQPLHHYQVLDFITPNLLVQNWEELIHWE